MYAVCPSSLALSYTVFTVLSWLCRRVSSVLQAADRVVLPASMLSGVEHDWFVLSFGVSAIAVAGRTLAAASATARVFFIVGVICSPFPPGTPGAVS